MTAMLIGKKIGMTRVYNDQGVAVPVTVIQAGPCPVVQIKTDAIDGYNALQLGFQDVKPSRRKGPQIGHAKKANVPVKRFLREMASDASSEKEVGEDLTVADFDEIKYVDITGTTKGKGFAGAMKRHGFKGLEASHGVERKHRSMGSIGGSAANAGKSRGVRKGKKMCGHMGHVTSTSKNHLIVAIDREQNLIIVKGPIAGPNNGLVVVSKAKTKI
jgi:large subunit ribosomal protein L3